MAKFIFLCKTEVIPTYLFLLDQKPQLLPTIYFPHDPSPVQAYRAEIAATKPSYSAITAGIRRGLHLFIHECTLLQHILYYVDISWFIMWSGFWYQTTAQRNFVYWCCVQRFEFFCLFIIIAGCHSCSIVSHCLALLCWTWGRDAIPGLKKVFRGFRKF